MFKNDTWSRTVKPEFSVYNNSHCVNRNGGVRTQALPQGYAILSDVWNSAFTPIWSTQVSFFTTSQIKISQHWNHISFGVCDQRSFSLLFLLCSHLHTAALLFCSRVLGRHTHAHTYTADSYITQSTHNHSLGFQAQLSLTLAHKAIQWTEGRHLIKPLFSPTFT